MCCVHCTVQHYAFICTYNMYAYMLLEEGAAVVVKDRWKTLVKSSWSQAVVESE